MKESLWNNSCILVLSFFNAFLILGVSSIHLAIPVSIAWDTVYLSRSLPAE